MVTAQNIAVFGAASHADEDKTGIFSNSDSEEAGGDAGNVTVKAQGSITLLGGGEIEAVTNSSGNGGNVTVSCGNLSMAGANADGGAASDISAATFGFNGGRAGNVLVRADVIHLDGGGEIAANTLGTGAAGSITVDANEIDISGSSAPRISSTFLMENPALNAYVQLISPLFPTGIAAASLLPGVAGAGKGGRHRGSRPQTRDH